MSSILRHFIDYMRCCTEFIFFALWSYCSWKCFQNYSVEPFFSKEVPIGWLLEEGQKVACFV